MTEFPKFRITPFATNSKYSLEIEDFHPIGGFQKFLTDFSKVGDGELLDWWQGIACGIGHITYKGNMLTVYWSDFPDALAFDCENISQAKKMEMYLKNFLNIKSYH